MTHDTPETPAGLDVSTLLDVLRRADFDAAARLLATAASPVAPAELATLADGLMRRRRWADAAWLWARVAGRDAAGEMKRLLCGNLAAIQSHRPEVYDQLVGLPATDAFGIGPAANGRPTILARRADDGGVVVLSGGADPVAAAQSASAQLRKVTPNGESVAVCGVGDGYLLQLLSQNPPSLFMDTQQAVFVLEPEPQVLLHAMMIHDFAGAEGPIAAERFRWFVGPHWGESLDAAVRREPTIGLPGVMLQQGLDGPATQERVQAALNTLRDRDKAVKREVEAYYAGVTSAALAELLGPNPPRTPRVMLLTTRFSTVLQYSTRDAAEAFRNMGWDAHVVIEPSPSHRLFPHSIRRALADFKPDLLLQIDHLRHEHGELFPPNLPFACWAQDHLPNLTNAAAGSRVGPRDFVLVGMPQMYVNRYGYPRRQTLGLTKLTRPPGRPASWRNDGEDLVYVSTASQVPDEVLRRSLAQFPPDVQRVMRACGERMIEHYGQGGSLPTHYDVRLFVQQVEKSIGIRVTDANVRTAMADVLFDRLGNLLYRQQALGWAASVASRRGLTLGVYGKGWDAHPAFAPYARGPVKYGRELEELTRRSRINLAMEPFFAPSHQRLLDGLAAGGFFLVRENPRNILTPALWRFLADHAPAGATTATQVRDALAPDDRTAFDDLIARTAFLADYGDPVEMVRDLAAAGLRDGDGRGEAIPDLAHVSFRDAATLEARVLEFLASAQRRREIAARQWDSMAKRRTYEAGMTRIVREIGRLIAEEAATAAADGAAKTLSREAA